MPRLLVKPWVGLRCYWHNCDYAVSLRAWSPVAAADTLPPPPPPPPPPPCTLASLSFNYHRLWLAFATSAIVVPLGVESGANREENRRLTSLKGVRTIPFLAFITIAALAAAAATTTICTTRAIVFHWARHR